MNIEECFMRPAMSMTRDPNSPMNRQWRSMMNYLNRSTNPLKLEETMHQPKKKKKSKRKRSQHDSQRFCEGRELGNGSKKPKWTCTPKTREAIDEMNSKKRKKEETMEKLVDEMNSKKRKREETMKKLVSVAQQQGTQQHQYLQQKLAESKQAKVHMEEIIKNGTLKKQSVARLKTFLKSQRQLVGGKKGELVERIQAMFA